MCMGQQMECPVCIPTVAFLHAILPPSSLSDRLWALLFLLRPVRHPSPAPFILCRLHTQVTDSHDRHTLMTVLASYYTSSIHQPDYKFSPSGTYYPPAHAEYK